MTTPQEKTLIVANWKMAPLSSKEASKIFTALRSVGVTLTKVETVVCPPVIYLEGLQKNAKGHRVVLGVQDCATEVERRHTGEISPLMIKNMGARFVILGHSEVRARGESDETVAKKVALALKSGLRVILCVGEDERDEDGQYLRSLKEQIHGSLVGVPKSALGGLVIAYEPLWAIGEDAKTSDTPEALFETVIYIRKVISDLYKKDIAMKMPILYGGSVGDTNAEGFLRDGGVAGVLVGRASRDPQVFSAILRIAEEVGKKTIS